MIQKVYDSERRVMELLWTNGPMTAKELAAALKENTNWSKTTSYTVIKKCIDKGFALREEPYFLCSPAITRDEISLAEADALIDQDFSGSAAHLIDMLVSSNRISKEELARCLAVL